MLGVKIIQVGCQLSHVHDFKMRNDVWTDLVCILAATLLSNAYAGFSFYPLEALSKSMVSFGHIRNKERLRVEE